MASGSYAISGLKLGDPKRKKRDRIGWKVEADKQSVKRGEVVTFTITAENAKFPDGTKRKFVISENFSEADIVEGKIAGEFELFSNKATVEIGIEESYEKPQDETLRFGVTSTFASASVNVESDGGEKDVKRLRGREEQKKLPPRQQKIIRQTVRQLELPPGRGSIVPTSSGGLTRPRPALPPGGPRLPGTAGVPGGGPTPSVRFTPPPAPQSSGIGDLFNNAIQMGTDAKGNYLTKQERIAAFKKGRPARPTKGVKPITSLSKKGGPIGKIGKTISKEVGGGLVKTGGKQVAKAGAKGAAKAGGKAVAKGAGKAVAKKIPGVGLLAGAAFGIERLLKGDIIGAVGELASGAASTVPGVGTAVSLGIDGALMAGDMMGGTGGGGQKLLPPAKFKAGGTIVPGMTNMPFSMPGLNGIFNEPGNPEVMSILPLNPLKGIADAFGGGLQNIFGGKEKEYKGIASAIGAEMEKRGIGDPLGLKGGKSFGNSVRDLLDKIPGIKDIFGKRDGGTQQGTTSPGGPGGQQMMGSASEQSLTESLIAGEEGVRENAYWDESGQKWTIGYGMTTMPDGSAVKEGDRLTKDQAVGSFRQGIAEHQQRAINQLGPERWQALDPKARAILTSLTYNYGSIPDAVLPAAKTGSNEDIAASMDALYGDNEGDLKGRRQREQSILRGNMQGTQDNPTRLDQDFMPGGQFAAPKQQNNQLNAGIQQTSYTPGATNEQVAAAASVQPQTPMQPTAMLEGPGTFIQGNTGASRGPHFHIGPEYELWGKPEGKAEVRRASFKIAKALIGKGETFWFTNANIKVDPNNPPDDATLMKYVEQEQIAHAGRDGGGSFGGIDIAGRDGLRLPLGVHNYKESATGFGNTATIAGTRAFVAHGMAGSGNTDGAAALAPGSQPSSGVQLMSNTSAQQPQGNPEDFFSFAFGAQGRGSDYKAPPNAAPTALLEGSANTAMASAGPKVAVVNNPVNTSTNVSGGGSSGGGGSSQKRGADMSDAGLLAYMARQRLLTLGA